MIVILPVTLIAALLVQEGFNVYERIQSGQLNLVRYFQQLFGAALRNRQAFQRVQLTELASPGFE